MGVYVRLSSCMQHPGISINFGDNMKVILWKNWSSNPIFHGSAYGFNIWQNRKKNCPDPRKKSHLCQKGATLSMGLIFEKTEKKSPPTRNSKVLYYQVNKDGVFLYYYITQKLVNREVWGK